MSKLTQAITKIRSTALALRLTEVQLKDAVEVDIGAVGSPTYGAITATYFLLHGEICRHYCDFAWQVGDELVRAPTDHPAASDPSTPCGYVWKGSDEPFTAMISTEQRIQESLED